MKIKKRWFLAMAGALLLLLVSAAVPHTTESSEIRWDIVSINPPTDFTLDPGGWHRRGQKMAQRSRSPVLGPSSHLQGAVVHPAQRRVAGHGMHLPLMLPPLAAARTRLLAS